MIDTARRNGVPLATAENYHRTPIERFKQKLVGRGDFGTLERVEIHGSLGHKGHEMAVARSYLGLDARPTRVRASGSGEHSYFSGERLLLPARCSAEVEFDSGVDVHFELERMGVEGSSELRSDFFGTRGSSRRNRFVFCGQDGSERPATPELRLKEIDGQPVIQEITLADDATASWCNPFAARPFPPASELEYFTRVDDSPGAWEIAIADCYLDMVGAIREKRAPAYTAAHSLTDVRIRLAILESMKRGGAWVSWDEPRYSVEHDLVRARAARWLLRQERLTAAARRVAGLLRSRS